MEPVGSTTYTDTQRMQLRGLIRVAGEIIGQYWPMRTFIHHNPLHGLEHLPFHEAVRHAEAFLGGRGYLPVDLYREYVHRGRIAIRHVDAALAPLAEDKAVFLNGRRISHLDVLRALLLRGAPAPSEDTVEAQLSRHPDRQLIDALAARLQGLVKSSDMQARLREEAERDRLLLGRRVTLSAWCDRILGTDIVERINAEMVKWFEAFLDEGHATWPMPGREGGFYGTWKFLASREWSPLGIPESREKIARLPFHPEDAALESLSTLGIPNEAWQDYFSLHLASLPGWAAFVRWRTDQAEYGWQQAYPIASVKHLAIRLWYERELAGQACRAELGVEASLPTLAHWIEQEPLAYAVRARAMAGRLPAAYTDEVARIRYAITRTDERLAAWRALAERYVNEAAPEAASRRIVAWRLHGLLQGLGVSAADAAHAAPDDVRAVLQWMDMFPEEAHGPVWLHALEAGYQQPFLRLLERQAATHKTVPQSDPPRPRAQAAFCIDVRSEPFRRHLESVGPYETYGFAGFFILFIRHQAWGAFHETEQFPVVMKAKHTVREVPRTYLDQALPLHVSRERLIRAGHTLLHDLKENVVTPYVMVESIGWFFGLSFFGKTFLPVWFKKAIEGLRRLLVPSIATTMTVDKLPRPAIEDTLAMEQRATIRRALQERFGKRGARISDDTVEALRVRALDGDGNGQTPMAELALSPEGESAFIEDLQRRYRIERRWASAQRERITRTGFTLEEQAYTVETALRMMGLTQNFGRLVLICGHGSTSDNNPFEAALDCGACGGNEGKPNARVLAAMANRQQVRERLAKNGLTIPADTRFVAGQMDTTTDEVVLFDREDLPENHREDVDRLVEDLRRASRLTTQERLARFPEVGAVLPAERAAKQVVRRSVDWSQNRPEWGLSGNTAFVIARREVTQGLNLDGRAFLHSYDCREDQTGRLLEIILTGPQLVAQWINMEHYFSTVDNDVYGAGSKIYHNVVGRMGVMIGAQSDLRLGLSWQTVMNGDMPYHEPMRLLTVIEVPRARVEQLIQRHELLQRFYRHEWVHLVVLEPETGVLYRYKPTGEWRPVAEEINSM